MESFDPSDFRLMSKGHQFEDFAVGQVYEHHWGRTLTEGDNTIFSVATCNWNPMSLNRPFAGEHGYGDVVVNPMLVLCTVVGLSVEDLSEAGGPFLGIDDCTFHEVLHPGDTVSAWSTVTDVRRSSSRPGHGIVTWHTEAFNQHDELVLDLRRTNLISMREAESA